MDNMPGREQFENRIEEIHKNTSKIKKKIVVMSGKGGVGKTTIAVNLAAYLAKDRQVALLDSDIDCPNINQFMGIADRFIVVNNKIQPIEKYGIKIISFASLQERKDEAIIWRGPMLSNVIMELLEKTEWGKLDYLVCDLPPGTSDVPLTIMQILKPDSVIVVTTPQEVSVIDAKKSANMAKTLGIPVQGIIENMSGAVFGQGGGNKAAEELGIPLLGSIALEEKISASCRKGKPFILDDSLSFKEFGRIVEKAGIR